MIKPFLLGIALLIWGLNAYAQHPYTSANAHSHNDYEQVIARDFLNDPGDILIGGGLSTWLRRRSLWDN
ncbi:MAG: hypothetical protein QM669_01525 [Siphonobacter sp.]